MIAASAFGLLLIVLFKKGFFLPWHRYFVATYEKALREECGWTGGQPYWDWLVDSESGKPMPKWPIFNPNNGFGGNGPFLAINESDNFLGIVGRTGGKLSSVVRRPTSANSGS